ncbi:hypothetical protein GYMLUDRAFT_61825 [Collybiopsis luxurians FD-317 M1]|uniref:Uncharacterized protein n=1 Tax=Collybiopsis luxurians FD-317 M1 TaxID=944289 RepID=A0A0D0CFB9_9AGAR|nr:hypothetical protein GYMLUDRAFT_61825 [Collybiopsis luxurians FD-317 M1]
MSYWPNFENSINPWAMEVDNWDHLASEHQALGNDNFFTSSMSLNNMTALPTSSLSRSDHQGGLPQQHSDESANNLLLLSPQITESHEPSAYPGSTGPPKQKRNHQMNSVKRRVILTPLRKQAEHLSERNRELFVRQRRDKANIALLERQLSEAKLQLAEREQAEQNLAEEMKNTAEEMEVEDELAGREAVRSEMPSQPGLKGKEKQQMSQNVEQVLNQQAAEIQRLLGLLSLQQKAALPSNNSSPSSAGPLSAAVDAGPASAARPSSGQNTSSSAHSLSGANSSFGARPSSSTGPSSASSSGPAASSGTAAPAPTVQIVTPRGRSEFITPAERRA